MYYMSGPVVFMETYYATFKLSVSLRSEVCHRGPKPSQKLTIFYERQGKLQWLHRLKIDSPWRKQSYMRAFWVSDHTVAIYYFQNIFASVILYDSHDSNPRKWVLYDHPYLQMKTKTKQNRYCERWLCQGTCKARLGSPVFLACIFFFFSILCSLPTTISDFSVGLDRIFLLFTNSLFCLPVHYLFLLMR